MFKLPKNEYFNIPFHIKNFKSIEISNKHKINIIVNID